MELLELELFELEPEPDPAPEPSELGRRGTLASGNGFSATARSACEVTQIGVWSLLRE